MKDSLLIRRRLALRVAVAVLFAAAGTLSAQSVAPPADELPSPSGTTHHPSPAAQQQTPARIVRGQNADSEPERIARLQRIMTGDEARLEELQCLLDDPSGDYARAERAFNELDSRLAEKKKARQQALAEGNAELAEQLQVELLEIEKQWSLAKKEFQLAIDQRKAQQASLATLQTKIEKDRQALAQLRGNLPAEPSESQAAPALPPSAAIAPSVEPATPGVPSLGPESVLSPGKNNAAGDSPTTGGAAPATDGGQPAIAKKPDQQIVAAEKAAAKSEKVARQAEENANSISERLDILRQDIELQRKLRDVANNKTVVIRDQLAELNAQLERKAAAGEDVTPVRRQIRETQDSLLTTQADAQRISLHLDELQSELARLQSDQVAALEEADQRRSEAETAQQAVAALNNPFSPRNMLAWLADHGLRILLILGAALVALWLGHLLEQRLILLIAIRSSRGNREERENRAKTLVSVLHNALRTVTVGAATVMVLDECGVPVGPILGGAAVLGLAVAFGAQSLIKDYFTGFMVLMEQQYMIGDVVKIGDVTGQVERISLRMTVLRDLEGRVHFIPHGQIATVTNLTHEWSRAVFEIRVAYKENVDRVIDVLLELARAIRKDPAYSYMILEEPVMLGVEAFGESAVVIKFMIKTRPIKQWDVKRELLRRIKKRFDELGIEIPVPQRMLYLANPEAAWPTEHAAGLSQANGKR